MELRLILLLHFFTRKMEFDFFPKPMALALESWPSDLCQAGVLFHGLCLKSNQSVARSSHNTCTTISHMQVTVVDGLVLPISFGSVHRTFQFPEYQPVSRSEGTRFRQIVLLCTTM